ncbi:MAG TPA: hypothetical protein VOA87_18910, partial [Thermoanaerobaculia bacterium]|nr:hypothetical protein [Thermoanaerobaculia bacterium]
AAAAGSPPPAEAAGALEVAAEQGDVLKTFRVTYRDGPRYPHLERDPSRPDLLSSILAPKAP